jgi:hypothetical protein
MALVMLLLLLLLLLRCCHELFEYKRLPLLNCDCWRNRGQEEAGEARRERAPRAQRMSTALAGVGDI